MCSPAEACTMKDGERRAVVVEDFEVATGAKYRDKPTTPGFSPWFWRERYFGIVPEEISGVSTPFRNLNRAVEVQYWIFHMSL